MGVSSHVTVPVPSGEGLASGEKVAVVVEVAVAVALHVPPPWLRQMAAEARPSRQAARRSVGRTAMAPHVGAKQLQKENS